MRPRRVTGGWSCPGGVLLALLLSACAGSQPSPSGSDANQPQANVHARARTGVAGFEDRQRAQAEQAMQERRWADAVWAWDVVLALAPRDGRAREQRSRARTQAEAAAADRRARAQQARQKGDTDGATRLYLEALAQWPEDAEAADALREIERQRTRRGNVAGFRTPGASSGRAAYAEPDRTRATGAPEGRNELEHASLLARQGDLDAAIAMLQPLSRARRPDPGVRGLLADFYWRKGDQLAAANPRAAMDALERALQLVPGHPQATEKLKVLRGTTAAPSRGPAR